MLNYETYTCIAMVQDHLNSVALLAIETTDHFLEKETLCVGFQDRRSENLLRNPHTSQDIWSPTNM